MVAYQTFQLENGLTVFVHEDHTSKMAVLNILYNVGSRDENPTKTGFAHLFEHLMFGGSKHVAAFDEELQRVGGENNAFTSTDITNYYITVPSNNIETAFWLESDRMMELSFSPKVLEVQRKVVIEEFKQRYLNQPYGDVWLKLRPLAYQVHPYQWAPIGKEIAHIEEATLEDVKSFFYQFYRPNNAYMVVAGDVTLAQVRELSEKWFAPIPKGKPYLRNLPTEPKQTEARILHTQADVPSDMLYKSYHMPGRVDKDYFSYELLGDLLGRGKSSFLYESLVKKQKIFNAINTYTTSTADPGLLVISGKVNDGIPLEEANAAVESQLKLLSTYLSEEVITKAKNQAESTLLFSEVENLNKAMNLAYAAFLGDPSLVNQEAEAIQNVSFDSIERISSEVLQPQNSATLLYHAQK